MKNICLGLIFMLVLLPQVSFGANDPLTTACNKTEDAESNAFFSQLGQERGTFINANKELIAKQDRRGKWLMSHFSTEPGTPPNPTAEEKAVFSPFTQKN